MKIGILAGTPTDTQMGIDYVVSKGHRAIGKACSNSPKEQTEMQVLHKAELLDISINHCRDMVANGAQGIFVNCNSLAGAIDMDEIRKSISVKLVSPLDVYSACACDYRSVSVIAANGQSLAAIERIILEKNNNCTVFGAGLIPLVIAIENHVNPDKIYNDLKIKSLIDSFCAIGCDALILGCTHFPYILSQIEENTSIPVVNPSDSMLYMLCQNN